MIGFDVDTSDLGVFDFPELAKAPSFRPKANRKHKRYYDIETFIAKLKRFRVIATQRVKRAVNFLAGIDLASTVIWRKGIAVNEFFAATLRRGRRSFIELLQRRTVTAGRARRRPRRFGFVGRVSR